MLIAFARNGYKDTELVPKEYSWEQLAQRLSKPIVGEKDGSYLIRGGTLKECVRKNENLLEAELLVIDGDSSFDPETGESFAAIDPDETDPDKTLKGNCTPIEVAREALDQLGYRYIIHTTHTHTPGVLNKWRAYIPAKMHSKEELEAAVEFVMAQMHGAGCYVEANKESRVWAQPWFLPRVKMKYLDSFKCYASLVGLDVDVKAAVEVAAGRKVIDQTIRDAERPLKTSEKATAHTGDGPIGLFNKQADIDTLRTLLADAGYKFAGKRGQVWRFIAPGSTTKTPGVTVFRGARDGDLVIYSHHGGHDPLSHRLSDAFGVLTRLRHAGNEAAALEEAKQVTNWKPSERTGNLEGFTVEKLDPEVFKEPPRQAKAGHSGPLFIPSKAFSDGWKPAEYLIDGLIQRGYCYSLTSPTGHGKTALVMMMSACIGTGRNFANTETTPGRVGYFAAENPNDVQARWIGMMEEMAFEDANVWFCPETIDLAVTYEKIAAEAEAAGGFDMVVVDTSQAFFKGEDENSNAQMVGHAKAMRKLTTLPGNPCVIILCHPVKNPAKDNLLPRGGGGFLAEVDGNLTLWNDNGALLLHHQGKFRGAGFSPLNFVLKPCNPARLKDARGRQIPTVVAEFMTEEQYAARLLDNASDQDKVMILILNSKGKMPIAEMARLAGWVSDRGSPHKGKVHRILMQLRDAKLAKPQRNGRWCLTDAGKKEISPKAKALGLDAAGENEDDSNEF